MSLPAQHNLEYSRAFHDSDWSVFTLQRESIRGCLLELKPLLDRHWEEIALNKDIIKLDVNYEFYLALERKNTFRLYTVRKSGKIVGYVDFFLAKQPHYQTKTFAQSDIFWLDPAVRSKRRSFISRLLFKSQPGVGSRLFAFATESLRNDGIDVVEFVTKNGHPAAGRALRRLGYRAKETIYELAFRS